MNHYYDNDKASGDSTKEEMRERIFVLLAMFSISVSLQIGLMFPNVDNS